MNANEILTAAVATLDQRGRDYDQPGGERSMGRIVAALNALTGHEMTEAEGWQFMACLKLVRMGTAADPTDSAVDCAAYAALAGEALWHDRERTARNKAALKAAQAAAPDPDDEGNPDCGKVIPGLAACIAKSREVFGGPEPDAEGWIPWAGGECPVDGSVRVEYRMRDGEQNICRARGLLWGRGQQCGDIVAYRVVPEALATDEQDADGWIPWGGGECPFPEGTRVDVRLTDGSIMKDTAACLRWEQLGFPSDIVAYRLVPEAPVDEKKGETWKPEEEGHYYYFGTDGDIYSTKFFGDCDADVIRVAFGNCFSTEENAEAKRAEIIGGK